MNNYLIIYNPISGQGIAKKNIKKIKNLFDIENKNYSIKKSQYKGHITELCKSSENYTNIIIVGGDGSFNEALNGFMNNKSINSLSVGFIPGGTGNSLMHDLNATSYETAVNIILKGNTKKIDVLELDFFGILGGMFAAVNAMDVSSLEFIRGLRSWFRPFDAWFGLIKGLFFGVAITSIACYQGYYTTGGATGVGRATTATVVISCVAIVFLDYILAAILLR